MKRSAQLKCLTICSLICRSAAELRRLKAAVGNLFGGGSMKDHESKPIRLDSLKNSSSCRYRNVRPHSLPAESRSFVGMARETAAMPPA